jgi:hypothetical protein
MRVLRWRPSLCRKALAPTKTRRNNVPAPLQPISYPTTTDHSTALHSTTELHHWKRDKSHRPILDTRFDRRATSGRDRLISNNGLPQNAVRSSAAAGHRKSGIQTRNARPVAELDDFCTRCCSCAPGEPARLRNPDRQGNIVCGTRRGGNRLRNTVLTCRIAPSHLCRSVSRKGLKISPFRQQSSLGHQWSFRPVQFGQYNLYAQCTNHDLR